MLPIMLAHPVPFGRHGSPHLGGQQQLKCHSAVISPHYNTLDNSEKTSGFVSHQPGMVSGQQDIYSL